MSSVLDSLLLKSFFMVHAKSTCKSCFILLLLMASGLVFSQQKTELAMTSEPTLITAGLNNEQLIGNIFLGKFLGIPFDRDAISFSILMDVYVTAYANHCGANLPANKMELTRQECHEWVITKNCSGFQISKLCNDWVTVGTGIYATPEMYRAKTIIDNLQTSDIFRNMLKLLSQENPVGEASDMVQKGLVMKQDIADLFEKNGCNSKGLRRFEDNLRLFALNKQPIEIRGDSMEKSNLEVLSKNQNLNKLVDDLIADQATNWAMNKYKPHNVTNVNITSRDAVRRPALLKADYQYQGWGGEKTGSVTLTFVDGLPNYLYFFDFPTICRTASRKIVADYASGGYVSR